MAKLTTGQRHAMPQGEYALPGKRFPINDAGHAEAAKSGAARAYNVGNINASQKAAVDRKADAKLGHPREHALAMASADHLHRAGYISAATHRDIRAKAGAKMDAHKARTFGAMG